MNRKLIPAFAAAILVAQFAVAPSAYAFKFPKNGFTGLHTLQKGQLSKKDKTKQTSKFEIGQTVTKKKRN